MPDHQNGSRSTRRAGSRQRTAYEKSTWCPLITAIMSAVIPYVARNWYLLFARTAAFRTIGCSSKSCAVWAMSKGVI